MNSGRIIFAGLILAAQPVPAIADPSSAELEAVKLAEHRGAQMYAYDQAAWHATDALMRDVAREGRSLSDMARDGTRGYVVEPSATNGLLMVTFYAIKDGSTSAVARYEVASREVRNGGIIKAGQDQAISPLGLRLVAAREAVINAARQQKLGLCSRTPPNTIVLPPAEEGNVFAYLLTSTTQRDSYPAGGHYRFEFDSQGKQVAQRQFMKSCLNVNFSEAKDKSPVVFGMTHLMDPQPTEVHAFISYHVPVFLAVITVQNRDVWLVRNGAIRFDRVVPENPAAKP